MLTLIILVITNKIFTNNNLIIHSNNINHVSLESRETRVYNDSVWGHQENCDALFGGVKR